jgi:hypothetical protein
MSGVMTVTPTPPTPPTREQILLRDRWLRTLAPEDRDLLDELPLREVDRRFDAWCEGREAAEDDGPG